MGIVDKIKILKANCRSWVRGKYAKQYRAGTNLIHLDPDVAKFFVNDDAVNQTLRFLIKLAKAKVA